MKNTVIIIIGIAALLFILMLLRGYYEVRHFRIKRYTIKTDTIKKQAAFAFISDLHNCTYGNDNEKIIAALKKEKPDFLIIGGDLIVGKRNMGQCMPEKYFKNAVSLLKGISGEFPILYTYGNHETRVKNRKETNPLYNEYIDSIKGQLEEQKIILLNDEIWEYNNIIVAGLEVGDKAYDNNESFDNEKLRKLMTLVSQKSASNKNKFHILVSHPPDFFEQYAEENIDLVLSGHNHGGTIRIPFLGGVISRKYKLFPKYSYGVYEKNGAKMILTGGLGDHTIHFRLFNMPEIVVITLLLADSV